MTYQFILPDIGEGVAEAEVQKWLVAPGDEVSEDQALVDVMTDKATVTLRSPRKGRIVRLFWNEGDLAKVHQPLLEMELRVSVGDVPDVAALVPPPPLAETRPTVTSGGNGRTTGSHGKALATPAVRALAREKGIDISAVRGTGPGGRVTKEDLHDRSAEGPAAVPDVAVPQAASLLDTDEPVEVIPVRGLRRIISEKMSLSKRTAAHFTFVEQLDATELVKMKERMAEAAKQQKVRLTYLAFVVKAAAAALKKHPWLNATLDDERGEIQIKHWYHIGIASKTPGGLTVPVIRNADKRSLLDIAREIERLSELTKSGKARPEDLHGSTFTITSLGAAGGLFATPIINHPEVAILGIHRIRPTPVVRDGQVVARDVMHVSLSFDHRVVDGDIAAAFAYTFVASLEDPSLLFMDMV